MTFLIVSLAWVFFRAADLPSALDYLKSMFGLGAEQAGTGLIGGIIYQPYYLVSIAVAAALVWSAPQTWDFTRSISWGKAVWCYSLFLVAIAVLVTRAHAPFIYAAF